MGFDEVVTRQIERGYSSICFLRNPTIFIPSMFFLFFSWGGSQNVFSSLIFELSVGSK